LTSAFDGAKISETWAKDRRSSEPGEVMRHLNSDRYLVRHNDGTTAPYARSELLRAGGEGDPPKPPLASEKGELQVGQRVRTTLFLTNAFEDEWAKERRSNAAGEVKEKVGHELYYVEHDDGVRAPYFRAELIKLPWIEPPPAPEENELKIGQRVRTAPDMTNTIDGLWSKDRRPNAPGNVMRRYESNLYCVEHADGIWAPYSRAELITIATPGSSVIENDLRIGDKVRLPDGAMSTIVGIGPKNEQGVLTYIVEGRIKAYMRGELIKVTS
jgi:hypothetical protein